VGYQGISPVAGFVSSQKNFPVANAALKENKKIMWVLVIFLFNIIGSVEPNAGSIFIS